MSGLIWIQIVWHSGGIPERIFQKVDFEKKSADDKKTWKNFQGANKFLIIFILKIQEHFAKSSDPLETLWSW